MYKAASGGKTKGVRGRPPRERRHDDERPHRNRSSNRTNNCKSQNRTSNRTENRTDDRTENRATNEHKHPNQYTKGADDEGK